MAQDKKNKDRTKELSKASYQLTLVLDKQRQYEWDRSIEGSKVFNINMIRDTGWGGKTAICSCPPPVPVPMWTDRSNGTVYVRRLATASGPRLNLKKPFEIITFICLYV